MLRMQGVTKQFGRFYALRELNMTVPKGAIYGLVGPNGAGKSTILNAITQGVNYTGTVLLNGTDVKKQKASSRAREIGVLAQNHHVGYEFTVEEIVRLGRYAHSSGLLSGRQNADEAAVQRALELTGMAPQRQQSVLTLSGGELQRTFLAQVFAQGPRLLLLDEPTNHLDLVYQKQVFALISEWLKTPGRAVVSVVHDLSLARAFGTNALLMHKGRTVAQGEVKDVMSSGQLDRVYGMDVRDWMRTMLSQWDGDE